MDAQSLKVLLIAPDITRPNNLANSSVAGFYPSLSLGRLSSALQGAHACTACDSLISLCMSVASQVSSVTETSLRLFDQTRPDVVGISVLSPLRKEAYDIARAVKQRNSRTIVVMGGPHVTILGESLLERYKGLADILVFGEGEETFSELLSTIAQKDNLSDVSGIAYLDTNHKPRRTHDRSEMKNLDSVPLPDYNQYVPLLKNRKIPTALVMTSVGCPNRCGFCSCGSLWNGRRTRPPENVVREIEYLISNYGVEEIRIWDDIFGYDKKQAVAILRLLVENGIKVRIGYLNTSINTIDAEILDWYKRAGGTGVFYGLESGSPRVREIMGKHFSNERVREIARTTKELGLKLGFFLIFGYPGETAGDVRESYLLLDEIRPDQVVCNLPIVYPGTELARIAISEGKLREGAWLDEEPRYISYVDNATVRGYIALFEQTFNREYIRTPYERVVYDYANEGQEISRSLAAEATRSLLGADK